MHTRIKHDPISIFLKVDKGQSKENKKPNSFKEEIAPFLLFVFIRC